MPLSATKSELAAVLCRMGYGEMRQVCEELASMCEDKEARPRLKTSTDFADLLYDWADSVESENDG